MLRNGLKLTEERILSTLDETFVFGRDILGKEAQANDIFCLFGPLGAGKTTLVKGIVAGFNGICPHYVTSPTFSLLNIYEGLQGRNVYHFDLYRLENSEQFLALGFDEYLSAEGICCIEWSEKIEPLLSNWPIKKIILSYQGENERYCEFSKK